MQIRSWLFLYGSFYKSTGRLLFVDSGFARQLSRTMIREG